MNITSIRRVLTSLLIIEALLTPNIFSVEFRSICNDSSLPDVRLSLYRSVGILFSVPFSRIGYEQDVLTQKMIRDSRGGEIGSVKEILLRRVRNERFDIDVKDDLILVRLHSEIGADTGTAVVVLYFGEDGVLNNCKTVYFFRRKDSE